MIFVQNGPVACPQFLKAKCETHRELHHWFSEPTENLNAQNFSGLFLKACLFRCLSFLFGTRHVSLRFRVVVLVCFNVVFVALTHVSWWCSTCAWLHKIWTVHGVAGPLSTACGCTGTLRPLRRNGRGASRSPVKPSSIACDWRGSAIRHVLRERHVSRVLCARDFWRVFLHFRVCTRTPRCFLVRTRPATCNQRSSM